MSSKAQSPKVARNNSCSGERPKSLPLHSCSVASGARETRSVKSHSDSAKPSQLDSCNLIAAKRLYQLRLDSGLTQDELAALSGESRKQVHRRESNKVFLGPLRALVVLERAAGLKAKK